MVLYASPICVSSIDLSSMVSDTLMRKRWCGHGLVFDRINRINRIEGDGRNAEGAKKGIP